MHGLNEPAHFSWLWYRYLHKVKEITLLWWPKYTECALWKEKIVYWQDSTVKSQSAKLTWRNICFHWIPKSDPNPRSESNLVMKESAAVLDLTKCFYLAYWEIFPTAIHAGLEIKVKVTSPRLIDCYDTVEIIQELIFTITPEILVRSLANFYRQ